MKYLVAAVYNLVLIIGTVWLVGWQDWTPWWFILTVCCLSSGK